MDTDKNDDTEKLLNNKDGRIGRMYDCPSALVEWNRAGGAMTSPDQALRQGHLWMRQPETPKKHTEYRWLDGQTEWHSRLFSHLHVTKNFNNCGMEKNVVKIQNKISPPPIFLLQRQSVLIRGMSEQTGFWCDCLLKKPLVTPFETFYSSSLDMKQKALTIPSPLGWAGSLLSLCWEGLPLGSCWAGSLLGLCWAGLPLG